VPTHHWSHSMLIHYPEHMDNGVFLLATLRFQLIDAYDADPMGSFHVLSVGCKLVQLPMGGQ
jgi:hypothetical protein